MAVISTLAEIFTDVHQGLGAPSFPNFAMQVKRAVHEACALYWTDLIQSDQNQVIKTSSNIPIEIGQYVYSLSDITDMTMPDWVELQLGTTDAPDWILVSVVNRDSLSMFRDRSELACSFYSQLIDNVLVNTVEFSYVPWTAGSSNNYFRIWYDPHVTVNTDSDDATGFPPEYNYLIGACAKIKLIPICMKLEIKAAKEDKTDKSYLEAQMSTWRLMLDQCVADRSEWQMKWRNYSLGSRANQGGIRRRNIMGDVYL